MSKRNLALVAIVVFALCALMGLMSGSLVFGLVLGAIMLTFALAVRRHNIKQGRARAVELYGEDHED